MIREIIRYFVMFVVLVLIQVLLLNNIQISGYVNPFLYVLFILLLPFQTPQFWLLILGFLLGLVIDIFGGTPGIHASAGTFMCFLRPVVIRSITSRENIDIDELPRIKHMGLGWFFRYTLILVASHHLFLFFIEVFSFQGFIHTLFRSILSTVFTIVLILISQYLIFKE